MLGGNAGIAAACGCHICTPPLLHLNSAQVRMKNARGAAALTQILVTWQRGQDDFVARIRKAVPWKRDLT